MKVGIITICDNNNYGNRLQCYALYKVLLKLGFDVKVVKNDNKKIKLKIKRIIKKGLNNFKNHYYKKRSNNFKKFNKKIVETNYSLDYNKPVLKEEFDYLVVGSDQVWNPNYGRLSNLDVLDVNSLAKKVSYAASFGVNDIEDDALNNLNKLKNFTAISVREFEGKEIIKKYLNNENVEVNVDPTLLLSSNDWDEIMVKPSNFNSKKYILLYFLGSISNDYYKAIEKFAEENECEIINILDKNEECYTYGPSEFLYLEKNAFLICTDSFHSSVFAFIFNKPFVIFDRDGKKTTSSRIDTLLKKFEIENRRFNGEFITNDNIIANYTKSYNILKKEQEKGIDYLRRNIQ